MAQHTIEGVVIEAASNRPVCELRVEAWLRDAQHADKRVGAAVCGADGAFAIACELGRALALKPVDIYFRLFARERLLEDTRARIVWSSASPATRVMIALGREALEGAAAAAVFQVGGTVSTASGVALPDLRIDIVDRSIGGETLLATAITDARGHYSAVYDPAQTGKPRADLFVRVIEPRGDGGAELERSPVHYRADALLAIDFVVDAARVTRADEYRRLGADIRRILGKTTSIDKLGAREVDYLAGHSRWDARVIAMAASAAQLSARTKIPAEHYYALMRTGVPGDAAIHRLSVAAVGDRLKRAMSEGVIGSDSPIEQTLKLYQHESVAAFGDARAPATVSSLRDLLAVSLKSEEIKPFLLAYVASAERPSELWSALAKNGIGETAIARLKTDGKLGFLTRQNAPLVARLRSDLGINAVEDLAAAGLYQADAWTSVIGQDIPAGLSAAAYAEGLAAQVQLSFPSQVVGEMVRRQELAVEGGAKGAQGELAGFFRNAREKIGTQAVKRWEGYANLTAEGKSGARLAERLYQMSPSNASMVALSKAGLHSAQDIARMPQERFMQKFGAGFPNPGEAAMVYKKAGAIHSATLSLATTFLSARSMPNIYAISGHTGMVNAPVGPTVPGGPTLEELLGNMDYCACDECKSVLGAAAYYVELLQFIDIDGLPGGAANPQAVLFGRRPDLQNLLLTCENTNVTVPYIDLINEVLEHFIVNGGLAAFKGFNMREDSNALDLLADPEHVSHAAYLKTKAEVYPHTLPFDMPLAALRLLMQAWDSTLADALGVFGTPAAARRERLGLNGAEYSILSNLGFRALPEYFGEPAASGIDALNAAISNGKTFSRRTGITYQDLSDILRTRFINPGYPLAALLTPLQVSLAQIQSLYTGALTDAAFTALLPSALDTAPYGGDVPAWLRARRELIMGLVTLTDVGAAGASCNFAALELRFALPDNAANKLTALVYHKLLRFIRMWKKFGWSIDFTDRVLGALLGMAPDALTPANLDAAFGALLARIANFLTIAKRQNLSVAKQADWLPLFDTSLSVAGRQEGLARLLRIGITDLQHFAEITGIDPLADDMATDAPSLLRFLDAWKLLKGARLKVVDLEYLLRHVDDSGALTPAQAALERDLKALRDSISSVATHLGAPPANADLAQAHARMALVYDAAVTDRFIGLVGKGASLRAPLASVEEALPAKIVAADARIGLDPFARQLTYRGILAAPAAAVLASAADALVLADMEEITTAAALHAFIADFKTALQGIVDAGQADLAALGASYPELKVIYDAVAGIAEPAAQAAALIGQIMPALRSRLETMALRTTLASLLKTAPEMVDVLTRGADVLSAHGDATAPILDDFRRLDAPFALDANGSYALHIDPPSTDNYILYVAAPAGTVVTLGIDGAAAIAATTLAADGETGTAGVHALRAGSLVALTLTLANLPPGKSAQLRWRTKGMAKTPVPAARLYLDARLGAARASLLRLQKAAQLSQALGLTPAALAHLAASNVDTAGVLNELDVSGSISGAGLHALWNKVALLAWLAQIKADDSNPDTWASLLDNPGQTTPKGKLVLAAAAGFSDADLNAVLAHFGVPIASLGSLRLLRQMIDALDFAVATGQRAADIAAWSTALPDQALIDTIKQSLREHQPPAAWRDTLQDVNDALRNQRRDALVSYILHHQAPAPGIDTADKLYEHFLIDVEMDACMLTSRIRLALSTVQLFVMRCLMHLEKAVSPGAIDAAQWAWMRRYRVWQANRKIFLFPENWLEPELRDNKSPFFRELEAELLKSDITDELAEDAYLSYLKKLDEVARLDVVGSYLQEGKPGSADDILHVFGRTNGVTRQYYYRRFEFGYWTPWDKISLNIDGEFLLPVVWKNQLYVFWLTMVQKPQGADAGKTPQAMGNAAWTNSARVNVEISLAYGQYYRGKWTSPKSSEFTEPVRLEGLHAFEPEKLVVAVRTDQPPAGMSERLVITMLYMGKLQGFNIVFTSKNAAPSINAGYDSKLLTGVAVFNYTLLWTPAPTSALDSNRLRAPGKVFTVRVDQPNGATDPHLDQHLLTKTAPMLDGFRIRPLMQPVANQWNAPLFYSDERALFFINPTEKVEMVSDFNGYYDLGDITIGTVEIPPLYEIPVVIIKDPLGPVANPLIQVANQNFERVITDNRQFSFNGAVFDARGMAQGGKV
ncbi:neuraminidase-like domain-containing protein [Massilia scottii]|uniref:neuraminidase-like domain-containing protein n=1 Tax=Massilia scottii TaxID=3057166 RepID=UPI00279671EA|nr:neuraminidase-like domain-containing protein [Massilia sp. CCM 9029]MDQ1833709.1 neuraminidase-like domain-containing protein [Massilia sp. CCM 9029]